MAPVAYKRVVLKLSGEALAGEKGFGLDFAVVDRLTDEIRDWVRRCAENLPLTQRAALYMREIDGQETEQVCNVLQISGTNLRVLLHRARARMRDCLEKHWNMR